jgi:hypothetical protein
VTAPASRACEAHAAPLKVSRERIWLYGATLAGIALIPLLTIPRFFSITAYHEDWGNFWAAGATVGTQRLLDPTLHGMWQVTHHMRPQAFAYPPAVAWFYYPFTSLSPMVSFFVDIAFMAGLCFIAALLVTRTYGFPVWFATATVYAWPPLLYAIFVGQSTPVALVLFLLAILALTERRPLLTGFAAGALLFKPTDAIVLVALLILRKQWISLAIVLACGALWYLGSVEATAGDWGWPVGYLHVVQGYYANDFSVNAAKSFSLPMLLMYAGVPQAIAMLAGGVLLLACVPLFLRTSIFESASMTPLVTLAISPHAWPYDVGLLIPTLCFVMVTVAEPWRTRLIAGAYVIAAFPLIHFDLLAAIILGGITVWLLLGALRMANA